MSEDEIVLKIRAEVDEDSFKKALKMTSRLRNRDVWDIFVIWACGFITCCLLLLVVAGGV